MSFQSMAMFPGTPRWTKVDIPDQTGKVVIVTGGNTGIGKETCLALVEHGAKVYLGARNEERAKEAINWINEKTNKPNNLIWLKMDLSDLQSVKNAAQEFKSKESNLHILFNNAGIMATPFSLTKDGFEIQWGTNVVGHFLLTKELLPILESTASKSPKGTVRIINTSSYGHNGAPNGGINFKDTKLENYSTGTRYGQSKLGNILLTNEITRRYGSKGIYSLSLHPGSVHTELLRGVNDSYKITMTLFSPLTWFFQRYLFITPEQGAITQLYAGTSPEVVEKNLNGKYLIPYARVCEPSAYAKDEQLGIKLWDHLEKELLSLNK